MASAHLGHHAPTLVAATVLATPTLNEQLYCIHAQHLRPSMAALQDTLSLHLLRPCGCIVLDDALLYLSAVVLRVHDAADN